MTFPPGPSGDALPHILIVDDDKRLRELLQRYLSENGFRVTVVADGGQARASLSAFAYDLIVLDVMMPGETGLELTRDLRRDNDVPILMLTAMGEAAHRIAGLEAGVDDYLPKPFEPRELVLRINTVLRRASAPRTETAAVPTCPLRLGALEFDLDRLELRGAEGPVRLTTAEARLLQALARQPGAPLSREELARRVEAAGTPRTVDVQITRLRRKIEPDPRVPRYLHTVRGRGYVLRPD